MPWSGLANPKSPILTTFPKPTIQFRKARSLIAIKQNGTWKRDHNLNGPYITLRLASVSDNIGRIVCFPKMEIRLFLFTPCKESVFSEFLLVESRTLGFGIRNTTQGIRNPPKMGFQNPSTWNPKSTTWNPKSKTVLVPLHSTLLSFQDKIYRLWNVLSILNWISYVEETLWWCNQRFFSEQALSFELCVGGEANKPKEEINAKTKGRVWW